MGIHKITQLNISFISKIIDLPNEQSFLDTLKLKRAIIYLLVDWSGPERLSRRFVYETFTETEKAGIPIFKIDCSDRTENFVLDWLEKQREVKKDLHFGGWGETLLVSQGNIIDFIQNPGKLGQEKTKEKINEWINEFAA